MNRQQRHAAILRILREHPVSTQTELAEALHAAGHDVVQTTVSRDIHELGLIKVRDANGRLVYAPPEAAEAERVDAIAQHVSSPPENAIPTRSPTGSDPRIAPPLVRSTSVTPPPSAPGSPPRAALRSSARAR